MEGSRGHMRGYRPSPGGWLDCLYFSFVWSCLVQSNLTTSHQRISISDARVLTRNPYFAGFHTSCCSLLGENSKWIKFSSSSKEEINRIRWLAFPDFDDFNTTITPMRCWTATALAGRWRERCRCILPTPWHLALKFIKREDRMNWA